MTYYIFATMMLLAAGAMFSLYRQLQIVQHKSYSLSKYFKHVLSSGTIELAISAVVYCVTMFLILNNWGLVSLILSAVLLAAQIVLNILIVKNSNKKLAFTARIKRLYIIAIVVLGVLLFVSSISFGGSTKIVPFFGSYMINRNLFGEIVRTICILLSCVTPLLVAIVWLVNCLIEIIISMAKGNKGKGKHDAAAQQVEKDSSDDENNTDDLPTDDEGAEI